MRIIALKLTLALLLASATASAQQSASSTGRYDRDLGEVYGGIQGVLYIQQICGDVYPDTHAANENAYKSWRTRYLAFLQEIQRHMDQALLTDSAGDMNKYTEMKEFLDSKLNEAKISLKQYFESQGEEAFSRMCQNYPRIVETRRFDLEYYFAEQMKVIRRRAVK